MNRKELQLMARGIKDTKFKYSELKKIYDHMVAHKSEGTTIDNVIVEETIIWMETQGYNTFKQYEKSYNDSIEIMRKATSLDRKETSSNDLRKKLGYNNAQWKIIVGLEKSMATELRKLIVEFMASTIVEGKSIDPKLIVEDKLYKELDLRWRNFSRSYLIPQYPGAMKNNNLRIRITGLFSTKLLEALKRDEVTSLPEESKPSETTGIL